MRRSRHRGWADTSSVPVVLPLIVVRPHGDDDAVTITIDGLHSVGATVGRATLGQALADIADQSGGPIRVEVHEPDGTRHADIITPPLVTDGHPIQLAQSRRRRRHRVEVAGDGFLPGETVLAAVTVRTETADHTGRVTVQLDHRAVPTGAARVLVFGTVSGTLLLAESS